MAGWGITGGIVKLGSCCCRLKDMVGIVLVCQFICFESSFHHSSKNDSDPGALPKLDLMFEKRLKGGVQNINRAFCRF
jgi:hypothetical protein